MDLSISYHIDSAQQFWSELNDILRIPPSALLARIDGSLRRFIDCCSLYHQQFLQDPLQLSHACDIFLDSELFDFHSGRMSDLLIQDATTNTNPHAQLIVHSILLAYGLKDGPFMRSRRKWSPIIPILVDHLMVDVDPNHEDWTNSANYLRSASVPIETKLRQLALDVLYQICRAQKFDMNDLRIFDDEFIEALFDLVEQTKDMEDDTLNYAIIKLIVALNEQFMVASLPAKHASRNHKAQGSFDANSASDNRVLLVLMRRLHFFKTFGENMIFMLNRSNSSTSDELCVQLLILKILYLLFTTPGTQDYFYTNDLRVLIDVFIRELSDLGDEHDSLRHTYLRVLHPLINNTQLYRAGTQIYKGPQLLRTLENLIERPDLRIVTPTTKRLVERCLSGEWMAHLRRQGGWSPTSSVTTAGSGRGTSVDLAHAFDKLHFNHRRDSDTSTSTSISNSISSFPTSPISRSQIIPPKSKPPGSLAAPTEKNIKSLKMSRSASDLKKSFSASNAEAPPLPTSAASTPPLSGVLDPRNRFGTGPSLTPGFASQTRTVQGNGQMGHRPARSQIQNQVRNDSDSVSVLSRSDIMSKKRRKPPPVPIRAGKTLAGAVAS